MKYIGIIFTVVALLASTSLLAEEKTTEQRLDSIIKEVSKHTQVDKEQIKFKNENGAFISKSVFIELFKNNSSLSIDYDHDLIGDAKNEVALQLLSEEQIQAQTTMLDNMSSLKHGDKFPNFSFTNTKDNVVNLNNLSGKPTLVSFYYSSCAPCIAEVPVLNQLKGELEGSVRMLSVTYETKDEALKFAKKHNFTWEILYKTKTLIDDIDLKGYPALILLDEKMTVVDTKIGGSSDITAKSLKQWIEKSLNKT